MKGEYRKNIEKVVKKIAEIIESRIDLEISKVNTIDFINIKGQFISCLEALDENNCFLFTLGIEWENKSFTITTKNCKFVTKSFKDMNDVIQKVTNLLLEMFSNYPYYFKYFFLV